ncbi:MAG: putative DNA modification/repair radical SAM protein, partial [Thermodesulfovibrionales bacterium]|nr:putative DNA modification/repair radical SAM protein [Thermodesulfovibrionales bacterium]
AVIKSPDYTMERLLMIVKKLRTEQRFFGYIHLKAIPGADRRLIHQAGLYADRMSINIELPTSKSLALLASEKDYSEILYNIEFIGSNVAIHKEERKKDKRVPSFVPAGQSTQLIIGATQEDDLTILHQAETLYNKHNLKRVYYSAYCHVNQDSRLPALINPPLLREHRLYQADWLLRFYGFKSSEILNESSPNLNLEFDPKVSWALRNPQFFPVDINKADYQTLLRVPGIGLKSAKRIIVTRKFSSLRKEDLQRLGVVVKRAKFFILCNGQRLENDLTKDFKSSLIEHQSSQVQLTLF